MMLRPLSPGEEPALQALALASIEAPYDLRPVANEKLFTDGFAGKPDITVVEEGERLLAFSVRCGRWLRLFGVTPSHRGRGIGRSLLDRAERAAAEESTGKLIIAAEPGNYFTPGIATDSPALKFLAARGYSEREEAINLDAPLASVAADPHPLVRRAGADDKERVLDWIAERFTRMWSFEVTPCFARQDPSIFIAEKEDGQILGFSAHEANNRGLGWYGPAGVDPDERGRGIGKALLTASLADLRSMGYDRAIIPWVSSVEFYERSCGARVAQTFSILEKSIR